MTLGNTNPRPSGGRLLVIGGGVRSGKSRFAVEQALRFDEPRAFIATAQAFDEEMVTRIRAHQAERQAMFLTIEAPIHLNDALKQAAEHRVIVVDCFTLLISNLLLEWTRDDVSGRQLASKLEAYLTPLLETLRSLNTTVICVTNEVGMGVVPPSVLGRQYRDLLGLTNQRLAAIADEVYFATLGMILRLRPAPVICV
jgi:adenosylcobinamide kinase / adenosylcobinamide-phosphate guanylyltransferase